MIHRMIANRGARRRRPLLVLFGVMSPADLRDPIDAAKAAIFGKLGA